MRLSLLLKLKTAICTPVTIRSAGNKRVNQHPKRKRRTPAEIAKAKKKSEASRKYYLRKRHSMEPEEYDLLLAIQNGLCFGCLRAKGVSRKLAVDHDHRKAETCDHVPSLSCRRCWRGLLCTSCNDLLGHARDDVNYFKRMIKYLENPPAQSAAFLEALLELSNRMHGDGTSDRGRDTESDADQALL